MWCESTETMWSGVSLGWNRCTSPPPPLLAPSLPSCLEHGVLVGWQFILCPQIEQSDGQVRPLRCEGGGRPAATSASLCWGVCSWALLPSIAGANRSQDGAHCVPSPRPGAPGAGRRHSRDRAPSCPSVCLGLTSSRAAATGEPAGCLPAAAAAASPLCGGIRPLGFCHLLDVILTLWMACR